jgi:tetratricopeptide (TPR) repeat protein
MAPNSSVFLSSCFADPPHRRLRIRDRVIAMTGGPLITRGPRPVWMAEDHPELRPSSPWGDFEKAEFCLDGVRAADCFVAIVTRRHGSSVTIDRAGTVPSSFFEAELFEAALLGKPSFIYLLEGYTPEGKLGNLLKMLAPSFPNLNLRPMSEDAILREIERLITHYSRPRWLRRVLSPPRLHSTVDTLFSLRHRPYELKKEMPPMRFLDSAADSELPVPDPSLVQSVIERAANTNQHQVRLTLLWFAIRALMGAPFTDPKHSAFLPLWGRAFGNWITSGAWYGLHGHTLMGCLAALGSLGQIRMTMAKADPASEIPHGALASEYYSISRIAGRSMEILNLALDHIEAAIDNGKGDAGGQLAIRAAIHTRMGHSDAGLADYSKIAMLQKDRGAARYGQALSDYGYALLSAGRAREGIKLMEQGLELLRQGDPSEFQITATRKLALGYARRGRVAASMDLALEAHDLARKLGALDQIRTLERLAKALEGFRRRRP